MTKTKLQIMREKKGLTIEQLSTKCAEIYSKSGIIFVKDWIDWIEHIEDFEKRYSMQKEYVKIVAQALGCSVDELVEDK